MQQRKIKRLRNLNHFIILTQASNIRIEAMYFIKKYNLN